VENLTTLEAVALRRMESDDMESVISLHRSAFWDSFNSRLGAHHLSRLYDVMSHDPNCLVLVARNHTTLVGVVSATVDVDQLRKKFMARLSLREKAALALRILFNPRLLFNFIHERALEKPVLFHEQEVRACLTAIAVHQNYRHAGIGRLLVSAVEGFLKEKGQRAFHLLTRTNNPVSREFYKRLGFVEIERRGKDFVLLKELSE
jgi:ribosomal protein S18 acetylase RimI-like enzyme